LKQDDAMSPILFNLVLEKVIRHISVNHKMEMNGKNIMLAYADDIVILGDTENDVMKVTEKLIESRYKMNLVINGNKTKYLVMTRHMVNIATLKVDPFAFEQVDEFKYLGVNMNTKNYMHNEIQLRISNANKAYFAMNKMLSSRLLSKATKEKLYTSYLRPIVMYACETWSTTQGDEEKLLTFKRKVLRTIHGPVRNQNGEYERRKNDELERLYNKSNIGLFLKAKRLEWAGHVWRVGESVIRNVLIRNPTKKRPRGRPRQRWLDRVKKDISDTDETKRLEGAMNRNVWRSLVEACKRP